MQSPLSSRSSEDQHDDIIGEEEIVDFVSPSVPTDPTPVSKQDQKSLRGKTAKIERKKKKIEEINLEEYLLQEMKKPCISQEVKESAESLFCKSIAADMEKLSNRCKIRAKNEIRNIMFKH